VSLAKTRIEMIKKGAQKGASGNPLFSYTCPISWAPFTIIGDGTHHSRTQDRSPAPRLAELDEERAALAAELDELVQMPLGLPPDTAPNMANSDRTHCRRLRK